MEKEPNHPSCPAPAALKAIQLVELFGKEKRPLKLTEIAAKLNSNKAMTLRVLRVFEKEGWVRRTGDRGPYRLTLRPLRFVAAALDSNELVSFATPLVKKLTQVTNCLVTIFVPDETQVTCIMCLEPPASVRVSTRLGYQFPYHSNAPGKVLLAYSSDEVVKEVLGRGLTKFTPNTISEPKKMLKEIESIRQCGYAVDHEEGFRGITCLNVPIFDYRNLCIATLGLCTLLSYNTVDDLKRKYLSLLFQNGEKISEVMGYVGTYPLKYTSHRQ